MPKERLFGLASTWLVVFDPDERTASLLGFPVAGTATTVPSGPATDRIEAESFALLHGLARAGDWEWTPSGKWVAPLEGNAAGTDGG